MGGRGVRGNWSPSWLVVCALLACLHEGARGSTLWWDWGGADERQSITSQHCMSQQLAPPHHGGCGGMANIR